MKLYSWISIGIFVAILIVLPSFSPFFDIPYNSKRYFQIIFLVLFTIGVVISGQYYQRLTAQFLSFPSRIRYSLSVVLVLGIISSILSNYPIYAFLEIGVFVLLILLTFCILHFYLNHETDFIRIFGVVLTLMVILYFMRFSISYVYNFLYPSWPVWPNVQLVQIMVNGEPFYPEPFLGFIHARYLNHIQTWTLPIFTLFTVLLPKRLWAYRSILYFVTSFWWMLVFASDARGTMLSSLLSLGIVFTIFRKRIKEWIVPYLYTFVAGLLSYLVFFKLIIPEGSRTVLSRFGDSGRFQIWANALDLFKENPIFGAGPMHFAEFSYGFGFAHPHNFYLQILSEWGVISFLILSVLFLFLIWKWFTLDKHEQSSGNDLFIQVALTASLSAGFLHSFLSGLMHTPLSQMIAAVIIGWSIGFYYKKSSGSGLQEREVLDITKKWFGFSLLSKGFLFITALFVLWGTVKTHNVLPESRRDYIEQTEATRFSPRFWDHGNIGI